MNMKNMPSKVFLMVAIVLVFGIVGNLTMKINNYENQVEQLENSVQQVEDEKTRIEERQLDELNDELLVKLCNNIDESYYVRNEIMYYNEEISIVEASYQALWVYVVSVENDVHPYKLAAIGVQESCLRHNIDGKIATSSKNAKGMFQLMPIAERTYQVDATKFEENAVGAAKFIHDLEKMYDDLDGQFAHYYAGSLPYRKLEKNYDVRQYVESVKNIYENMMQKYG